jgi:transposase-like protein
MANRQRRVSDERQDMIASMYESGQSLTTVARQLGTTRTTVRRVLQDRGIQARPNYTRVVPVSDFPLVAQRYQDGEEVAAIADTYHCSGITIRKILDDQNVVRRAGRGRNRKYMPEEIETINRMASEGAPQHVIARALGSTQSTISRRMRTEDIPLRQGQHGISWDYLCLDCGSHNIRAVKSREA